MNKNETLEQKVYRYLSKHTPKGFLAPSYADVAVTVEFRHTCLAFREAIDDAIKGEREAYFDAAHKVGGSAFAALVEKERDHAQV